MLSALFFVALTTFSVTTSALELRRKLYSDKVENWYVKTYYSDRKCKFPVYTESYASVCTPNGSSSSYVVEYTERNGNITTVESYFNDPFCEKFNFAPTPYYEQSMRCYNGYGGNKIAKAGALETQSVNIIDIDDIRQNANPQFYTVKIASSPDIAFTGPHREQYLDPECKNLIYKMTYNSGACIYGNDKYGASCYSPIGCNYSTPSTGNKDFDCSVSGFADIQCSIKHTSVPTARPTARPSGPTAEPSSAAPTYDPTSQSPSAAPTTNPSSSEPSAAPTYGPNCVKSGSVYTWYQLDDDELYLSGCDGSGYATSSPSSKPSSAPVIAAIANLVVEDVVEVSSSSSITSVSSESSSSLTSGTVAGIVVGGVASFALLFAFMFYYLRQGKEGKIANNEQKI